MPRTLVFAKLPDFPWWPAVIGRCPTTREYKDGENRCWVFLFGLRFGAWVSLRDMRLYDVRKESFTLEFKALVSAYPRFEARLKEASKLAEEFQGTDGAGKPLTDYCGSLIESAIQKVSKPRFGPSMKRQESEKMPATSTSGEGETASRVGINEAEMNNARVATGTLVFGKLQGLPWWPAIIGSCPANGSWKDKEKRIWMFFFGVCYGAWLPIIDVMPYSSEAKAFAASFNSSLSYDQYKDRVKAACSLADEFASSSGEGRPTSEYSRQLTGKSIGMPHLLRSGPGGLQVESRKTENPGINKKAESTVVLKGKQTPAENANKVAYPLACSSSLKHRRKRRKKIDAKLKAIDESDASGNKIANERENSLQDVRESNHSLAVNRGRVRSRSSLPPRKDPFFRPKDRSRQES